jgi:type I restriction enzyme R subunit
MDYKTSKARVCVTVGMMTTGWDCPNILNLALMRPIFSPTEFIQIKGRGTRIFTFEHKHKDGFDEQTIQVKKESFKLFDFFAVCEYFEEKYDYDQVLKLPSPKPTVDGVPPIIDPTPKKDGFEYTQSDQISSWNESKVGFEGMKVDKMFFQQFEEEIQQDTDIVQAMEEGNLDTATYLTLEKFLKQDGSQYSLDKLRRALKIDRKISVKELLDMIFNGNEIKNKDILLQEEFEKFISTIDLSEVTDLTALKYYFFAYLTDPEVRQVIDTKDFTSLNTLSTLSKEDFVRVEPKMREVIPNYIRTYVTLDKFIAA